jgi:hypothetical protein
MEDIVQMRRQCTQPYLPIVRPAVRGMSRPRAAAAGRYCISSPPFDPLWPLPRLASPIVRAQCSVRLSDAEFIQVPQQFRRILIDTIGASKL